MPCLRLPRGVEGHLQLGGQAGRLEQDEQDGEQDQQAGGKDATDVGEKGPGEGHGQGWVQDVGHRLAGVRHSQALKPVPKFRTQEHQPFLIAWQAVPETFHRPGGRQREEATEVEQQEPDDQQGGPFGCAVPAQKPQQWGGDHRDEGREQYGAEQGCSPLHAGQNNHKGSGHDQAAGRGAPCGMGGHGRNSMVSRRSRRRDGMSGLIPTSRRLLAAGLTGGWRSGSSAGAPRLARRPRGRDGRAR